MTKKVNYPKMALMKILLLPLNIVALVIAIILVIVARSIRWSRNMDVKLEGHERARYVVRK